MPARMDSEPAHEPGLIETLAAGVAHEVRNPLSLVQINLNILEQELLECVPDRDAHVFKVLRNIAGEIEHPELLRPHASTTPLEEY